jgi:hypothetical protein
MSDSAVEGLYDGENPIHKRDLWANSKQLVPSESRREQDVPVFRGAVSGGNDAWRVAYWDDVLWWVTDRLDRIDPQLWRVAP